MLKLKLLKSSEGMVMVTVLVAMEATEVMGMMRASQEKMGMVESMELTKEPMVADMVARMGLCMGAGMVADMGMTVQVKRTGMTAV